MSPSDLATSIAHRLASLWVESGQLPPSNETAAVVCVRGIAIVVSIAPVAVEVPRVEKKLTGLQKDVLDAAPSHLHFPVSLKKLAKLSGYAYSSHFRDAVSNLVERGLLVRFPKGVKKPKIGQDKPLADQ